MSENSAPRAVLFGCAGPVLTDAERRFFAEADPFGFILFARNVETRTQVRALTDALRAAVGRDDAPILIDQEGGRVRRLRPPQWRDAPAMRPFGALYAHDPEAARRLLRLNTHLLAADLREIGLDVDCAPVLDTRVAGAHDIIGDRAFSGDPAVVADLGRVMHDAFLEAGVLPVVKHIPGHGRARCDSHEDLPMVESSRTALAAADFVPFRALRDAPFAMTAHIVYTAIDAENPATTSDTVISQVIRAEIGFDGLLMTDDLSMKALSGPFETRARRSLEAGCDLVLHCNGDMDEMQAVCAGTRAMDAAALRRWRRAKTMRAKAMKAAGPPDLDIDAAGADLAALSDW